MNRPRIVLSYTMKAAGTPEQVFPLLCPVREYEWIEIWDCTLVHSLSGIAELGCIFITDFPQEGSEETWVVSRYEPPKLIEFIRVNPSRVIHHTIHLAAEGAGQSSWTWTQTITALNDEGEAWISGLTDTDHAEKMKMFEKMLNHFLSTGTMLRITKP